MFLQKNFITTLLIIIALLLLSGSLPRSSPDRSSIAELDHIRVHSIPDNVNRTELLVTLPSMRRLFATRRDSGLRTHRNATVFEVDASHPLQYELYKALCNTPCCEVPLLETTPWSQHEMALSSAPLCHASVLADGLPGRWVKLTPVVHKMVQLPCPTRLTRRRFAKSETMKRVVLEGPKPMTPLYLKQCNRSDHGISNFVYKPHDYERGQSCRLFPIEDRGRLHSCLKGKHLLLVGDSHIRDMLSTILHHLGWSHLFPLENPFPGVIRTRHGNHIISHEGVSITQIFIGKQKIDERFHEALTVVVGKNQSFDHVLFSFGVWHVYDPAKMNVNSSAAKADLFVRYTNVIDEVLSYTSRNRKEQPPFTFLPIRPIHPPNRLFCPPQNCISSKRLEAYRRLERCVFDCAMAQHGVRHFNTLNITKMVQTPLARAMSTFDGHHYKPMATAMAREIASAFLVDMCHGRPPPLLPSQSSTTEAKCCSDSTLSDILNVASTACRVWHRSADRHSYKVYKKIAGD